jgi:hypothetical protein
MKEVILKLLVPFYNFLSEEYIFFKQKYQDNKDKGIRTYNKIISYISILLLVYFLKEIIFGLLHKFDNLLKNN